MMTQTLVNKDNLAAYNYLYASDGKSMDHQYPNENLVRLVQWYFEKKDGAKILDHGFGTGENLIHLLKKGYKVYGLDISPGVLKLVKNKLIERIPDKKKNVQLGLLKPSDRKLPYEDNFFDYIISFGVIEYFSSEREIRAILKEFYRVLKPNGKMIISTIGPTNQFCIKVQKINRNIYRYQGKEGRDKKIATWKVFVFKDENHIRKVFNLYKLDEIGWYDNHYCGVAGFHFVILSRK